MNCAGVSQNLRILRVSETDADEILDVNLKSAILACKEFGRSLVKRKTGGCIVNVSSLLAYKGAIGVSVYAASKAGLLGKSDQYLASHHGSCADMVAPTMTGLTSALAVELAESGIRVNAIVPGYIETNMTKGKLPPQTVCILELPATDCFSIIRLPPTQTPGNAWPWQNSLAHNCTKTKPPKGRWLMYKMKVYRQSSLRQFP